MTSSRSNRKLQISSMHAGDSGLRIRAGRVPSLKQWFLEILSIRGTTQFGYGNYTGFYSCWLIWCGLFTTWNKRNSWVSKSTGLATEKTWVRIQATTGPHCEYELLTFSLTPNTTVCLGLRRSVKRDGQVPKINSYQVKKWIRNRSLPWVQPFVMLGFRCVSGVS